MFRKMLAIVLLIAPCLWARDATYLTKHGETITIGNQYLERVISIAPDHVGTMRIVNRLSGRTYTVSDDVFGLKVVFSGTGPVPKEPQTGMNDVMLTAKDFQFTGYQKSDLTGGGKKLVLDFAFNWEDAALRVQVDYVVYPGQFSFRKSVQVSDSLYGIQFLDRIYVESMSINPADLSRGQFGQPVFNHDIFMGVEYPTVENVVKGNHVMIGYVVGQDITHKPYKSHTAILGSSPSNVKLEQTFMTYVKSIEVLPPHPFLLYNTWYDLRTPLMANGPAGVENEKNVLKTIDSFKRHLYDKYGIALNGFVLDGDAGWNNANSIWAIDSTRFPDGFTPIVEALDSTHTKLGLWSSPFGGYPPLRDSVVHWGKVHGYETTGPFYNLEGPKYRAKFMQRMDDYTRQYKIGYFKWDGYLSAFNTPVNGRLPGIYSREEGLSDYIKIMKSVRRINPKIFLNITSGTWLSPWWLKYANCIWMQGEDYGYQENVPSINERDKAILYKDAVLWNDYQKQHLLFPISGLMTHGIIRGRYNLLGGVHESLASFSDEVMMYFGRGVMMWELYVSPDLLSAGEWNAIASAVKWADANQEVLQNSKMVLGDPIERQVYGYIHLTKDKGIFLLRNPYITKQRVNLRLTANLGDIDPTTEYYVRVIYPYNFILSKPVKVNQDLSFNLKGYEVLTAELIPANDMDKSLPIGVKFSLENGNLMVYGEPGQRVNIESVGKKDLGVVRFGNAARKVNYKVKSQVTKSASDYATHLSINVPADYRNPKFALLLETEGKLQERLQPDFVIKVNGVSKTSKVVEGDGTWFWVITDLEDGHNSVDCSIRFKGKEKGKVSLWMTGEQELVAHLINGPRVRNDEVLPAKPYPPTVRKEIIPISHYSIQ